MVARSLHRRWSLRTGKSIVKFLSMSFWQSAGSQSRSDFKHCEVFEQLSDRLPSGDTSSSAQEPTIVDLLSQIVNDNATLNTRLENAQGTFENQVAEISAYKSEARTDPMTGLANRRVFDEQLQEWLVAWHRYHVPVSILLFDVDHFRGFNNDYGRQAGDAVLTQVAHALKRSMGENDLVSRIGGEEFVVIIDRDSRASAQTLAERARREIEQAGFGF